LLEAFARDTTRLDIMQEVGKIYYYLRDYENAYRYYKRFVNIRNAYDLNIYYSENAKIGFVYSKMGFGEEGEKLMEEFRNYAENDHSIYKHSSLALFYSYQGEIEKAIEHLKLFSKENHYFYWTVLFMPIEPMFDNIIQLPEFKSATIQIEDNFQSWHQEIANSLQQKGLI
jgi:tetratricopeptide (TPR) repeat protein